MKTFLGVLLFLLFSTTIFSQTTFVKEFQNANHDTLKVWDFDKQYETIWVTVENLSATTACSLSVRGATFIRDDDSWNVNEWESAVTDTTFAEIPIRDNTWTVVSSLIVPASSSITYWLSKFNLEGVKVYLTNTTGGNCRVIVEGNP